MLNVLPRKRKKFRPTNILAQFSLYNRRLKYQRIPEKNFNLTVLKLDGSYFCFQVARNATVGRLKLAIEDEFNLFYKEEREQLWSLVWSNFCLCYEGQKLILDTAPIRKYGIKDGDQIYFIQHLTVDLAPTSHQSKNLNIESRKCSKTRCGDVRDKHFVTNEDHQNTELTSLHCGEDSVFFSRTKMGVNSFSDGVVANLPWLRFRHFIRTSRS